MVNNINDQINQSDLIVDGIFGNYYINEYMYIFNLHINYF